VGYYGEKISREGKRRKQWTNYYIKWVNAGSKSRKRNATAENRTRNPWDQHTMIARKPLSQETTIIQMIIIIGIQVADCSFPKR